MLEVFGLGFLVWFTDAAAADPAFPQDQNSAVDLNYKLLAARLDQLELKLQNTSDAIRAEQNNTNTMLEKLVNSLNEITRQMVVINSCAHDEVTTTRRYRLQLPNPSAPITVVCDVEVLGGGWMVVQQRLDGSVNFNRSWAEYRKGFGVVDQASEFWLGLETIHQLTKAGDHELLVELKDENGQYGYARYGGFKVAGEYQEYELTSLDEYNGTIGNSMSTHANKKFSTFDRDNDHWTYNSRNCAQHIGSGWWFSSCISVSLNGPFKKEIGRLGIYWSGWTFGATYCRMLIRRKKSLEL